MDSANDHIPSPLYIRPLLKSIMRAVHYDTADATFEWKFYIGHHGKAVGICGENAHLDDGLQWVTIVSTHDAINKRKDIEIEHRVEQLDPDVLKRIFHTRHDVGSDETSSKLIDILIDRLANHGFVPYLITNRTSESPKTPSFVYFERGNQVISLFRLRSSTAAIIKYNNRNKIVDQYQPPSWWKRVINFFRRNKK